MKKIIITMVAIAFSLSAYSDSETDTLYVLDYDGHVGKILCVADLAFFYPTLFSQHLNGIKRGVQE